MKVNKRVVYVMLFSALLVMSLNCREEVPIREMSSAKVAITDAQSVQADRYAPDEIKAARTKLMEANAAIANSKTDDAQSAANASYKKAVEAYNKAVPLLAKDAIGSAEKSVESATEAYAEVLAKSQFASAKADLQSANQLFEDKQYYQSYQKAGEADRKARAARDAAIGNKSVLSDSIEDVNITITKARQYHAERYAPEKLNLAEENVRTANNSLANLKLKEGFAAVEVAKMNADDAYISGLQGTSRDSLTSAREAVAQAEKSPGAAAAATDLGMAKESLRTSETLFNESKYKESIAASEDSKRFAQSVMAASGKVTVAATGKQSEAKKAKVGAGRESASSEKQISDDERGYRIYVVKYNKDKRDCLWRIADKFYGNGLKWNLIYEANRGMIANPRLIQPGWRLRIPLEGAKAVEKTPAKEAEPKEAAPRESESSNPENK